MISTIQPVFVEFIPEKLEDGKIYISKTYLTASHSCCCGCGHRVVTPLRPTAKGWGLTDDDGLVTLYPSIGNWSFPCRSHYWIRRNQIIPSYPMTPQEVNAARRLEYEQKELNVDMFDSELKSESVRKESESEATRKGLLERLKQWFFR